MKKSWLLAIILLVSSFAFGQNELLVQSSEKGLFVNHTVSAKETFYSIGRLYNIPPKDIALHNGIDMANGLNIGQSIQIPLTAGNFSQSASAGAPVYYVVGEKEGLYRVSLKNNKVLMANLRKWNNLSSDAVSAGQRLIVGYITSPEAGALASRPATPASTPARVVEKPVTEETAVAEKPKTEPVASREEPRRTEPATTGSVSRPPANPTPQTAVNDGNGGYFKKQYEHQSRTVSANKDLTATASIFKTASGWQDAKYYALMDGVEPGTIVRVINPSNNKAVYAKVLGQMGGIRQNAGLDVRISSAAANVLDIAETEKFIVRVNY